jgi:hypothetical protein
MKTKTRRQGKCACEKLDARGLYDRADAVVGAEIKRVIEKGTARFVYLNVVRSWKINDLPRHMTVYIGDVDSECKYPVPEKDGGHLFYLRRDGKGGFATDYCSGNLVPGDDANAGKCLHWLDKQENRFPVERGDILQEDVCLKR